MDNERFPFGEDLLRQAGWYPGRRVDVAETVRWIIEKGFVMNPEIERFLEEFNGLALEEEDSSPDEREYAWYIQPQWAVGDQGGRRGWEKEIRGAGLEFAAVGGVAGNMGFLALTETGAILLGWGGPDVYWVGDSFPEALEAIYRRRPRKLVREGHW